MCVFVLVVWRVLALIVAAGGLIGQGEVWSYELVPGYDLAPYNVSDASASSEGGPEPGGMPWYCFPLVTLVGVVGGAAGEAEFLPKLTLASLYGRAGRGVGEAKEVRKPLIEEEEGRLDVAKAVVEGDAANDDLQGTALGREGTTTNAEDAHAFAVSYAVSLDLGNTLSDLLTPLYITALGGGGDGLGWISAGLAGVVLWKLAVVAGVLTFQGGKGWGSRRPRGE
mmetsp:Transcript_302/g.554  ORF Transcript_302/g.554 Transcript_302/m.554 type:complete len:225 (-) Transcript_302:95-769(-)